jgi:hypothetical protein
MLLYSTVKSKEIAKKPPRILRPVSQHSAAPSRAPLTAAGKKGESIEPVPEDPWSTYTPIRPLERNVEVIAAHTREVPVEMVCVQPSTVYIELPYAQEDKSQ